MQQTHAIPQPLTCDSVEVRDNVLACASYQLQPDGSRVGEVRLYDTNSMQFLGAPGGPGPGVFDMKWHPTHPHLLATALSDGTIGVLSTTTHPPADAPSREAIVVQSHAFCLSLDWMTDHRLAASCSSGHVVVCDAETKQPIRSWSAHMFETWIVACGKRADNQDLVATGADDGVLKLWDVREATPLFANKTAHGGDSGVTCAQFDSTHDFRLVTGGYDGRVCVWDTRALGLKPLSRSPHRLGGGVWRVKISPHENDHRLLAACMRGGFRVLDYFAGATDQNDLTERARYSEAQDEHWEALAYGADWLPGDGTTTNNNRVAGCTFYDKTLRLFHMDSTSL